MTTDRFGSSWRPLIGYVCALALAGKFVIHPALVWLSFFLFPTLSPPAIGSDGLIELIIGMMGLAGMRTYEKVKKPFRGRAKRSEKGQSSLF